MQHNKLLVVGELNVDLLLNHIEGFPKIATEIIAHDMNLILEVLQQLWLRIVLH